jgi:NADH-quinone oxidoreductase subunit F
MDVLRSFKDAIASERLEVGISEVGCIGMCYLEPILSVQKNGTPEIFYGHVDEKRGREILARWIKGEDPCSELAMGNLSEETFRGIPPLTEVRMLQGQVRIVLRNCGLVDPNDIDDYIARDGYGALAKALCMTPASIIEEIKGSGLRGRGGAGFPTGRKWEICASRPRNPKYLICNADEGDPGAFMNRALLESDPHSVLEGMIIAGYAIGAKKGYVYIRAEYPLAVERLEHALDQMRVRGLLGEVILGTNFGFDIGIKQGAGAFVCGEETALIAAIEGKRGMPRPRPPYPAESGLWGHPTVINNVETLGTIPRIIESGASSYAKLGTRTSKGTKTFALAGKINNTGLIEVPMGITLREIIDRIGGGISDQRRFKAAQTGGPSGGCLPSSYLDTPIDYESLKKAGSMMGSGGLIIMDENTCAVDIAKYFLRFTGSESCGKCVPCRVGTKKMLEILERITEGKGVPEDIQELNALANTIKTASLCGLGQTAPNPVLTTLRFYEDEYRAHIEKKECPAGVCKALTAYWIDPKKCIGCTLCLKACPVDAISGKRKAIHRIDQDACVQCGACFSACPSKVDAVKRIPKRRVEAKSRVASEQRRKKK